MRALADMLLISVNKSLKGKWASLACHETGSLVVQVSPVCTRKFCVPNVGPSTLSKI
jgi:hypothetical protein